MKKIIIILATFLLMISFSLAVTNITDCLNINSPGDYILTQDIEANSGDCIWINTSNLLIDCDGYSIVDETNVTSNYAVYSEFGATNLTIENCVFGNFSQSTMYINNGGDVTIQNNVFNATNIEIRYANVTGITFSENSFYGTGTNFQSEGTPSTNVQFVNNEFYFDDCSYGMTYSGNYFLSDDIIDWNGTNGGCLTPQVNNTLIDCQGHRIDGLPNIGPGYESIGIDFPFTYTTNVTIQNCEISDIQAYPIRGFNTDGLLLINNTITDYVDSFGSNVFLGGLAARQYENYLIQGNTFIQSGISFQDAKNVIIKDNTFGPLVGDSWAFPLGFSITNFDSLDILIENNLLEDTMNGLSANSVSNNATVFGNTFRNIKGQSINLNGGQNHKIYNNVIETTNATLLLNTSFYYNYIVSVQSCTNCDVYNNSIDFRNKWGGLRLRLGNTGNIYYNTVFGGYAGIELRDQDNTNVYNNTIYEVNWSTTYGGFLDQFGYGLRLRGNSDNNSYYDNIVYDSRNGFFLTSATTADNTNILNNEFYNNNVGLLTGGTSTLTNTYIQYNEIYNNDVGIDFTTVTDGMNVSYNNIYSNTVNLNSSSAREVTGNYYDKSAMTSSVGIRTFPYIQNNVTDGVGYACLNGWNLGCTFVYYDTFESTSETTDFTLVPDLENASNVVLATSDGGISWQQPINVSGANLSATILISDGIVAVNTSSVHSSLDSVANVVIDTTSVESATCGSFELYYASTYYDTPEEIIANGQFMADDGYYGRDCRDSSICQNVICINNAVTFEAQHFDGFAIQQNPAAREGCLSTLNLVYAGFGLLAVIIVVLSAFTIISVTSGEMDWTVLIGVAITVIGLAFSLMVGYIIMSATGTVVCT